MATYVLKNEKADTNIRYCTFQIDANFVVRNIYDFTIVRSFENLRMRFGF